jgi:cell division transport system permease protein
MRIFFRYAFRETASNLWRNRLMTLAAVLTVAVSLSLVGAALLVKQTASQVSSIWQQQTRVTVWLNHDASKGEISSVRSQLAALPYVHGTCSYQSKRQSYNEARLQLSPNLFANLSVKGMVTAFICEPQIPTDTAIIRHTFINQPGIYDVTAPDKQIKVMEHVIRIAQYVLAALALTLFVSAVVLILNTIQLAIFARRREVTVMKLVGATNWFIRIPYITEGFIQGLLGSVIAVALLTGLHAWIPFSRQYHLSGQDILGTNIVVLILGAAIGSLGSAFAIRRFLDV